MSMSAFLCFSFVFLFLFWWHERSCGWISKHLKRKSITFIAIRHHLSQSVLFDIIVCSLFLFLSLTLYVVCVSLWGVWRIRLSISRKFAHYGIYRFSTCKSFYWCLRHLKSCTQTFLPNHSTSHIDMDREKTVIHPKRQKCFCTLKTSRIFPNGIVRSLILASVVPTMDGISAKWHVFQFCALDKCICVQTNDELCTR